jgi:Flp pilus assembly protein TadG
MLRRRSDARPRSRGQALAEFVMTSQSGTGHRESDATLSSRSPVMRFPRDRRSIRALSSKRSATRHRSAERGQILIIFALSLIAILAMAGLLIDGGRAWGDKRQAQTAADTAALNAAKAFAAQPDGTLLADRITAATAAAKFISDKNGFPAGTVSCPGGAGQAGVTVNAGFAHVTSPPVANQTYIEVTVSRPMQTTLAGVVGQSCWMVGARAVASVTGAVRIAEYPAIFAGIGPNPCSSTALTNTGNSIHVTGKVISNSGIHWSSTGWVHTGTTTRMANPPNTCGTDNPGPPETTEVTVKTEFPVTYSFCYPGLPPANAPPPDCVGHLPWTITNNMTGETKACTFKAGSGSNDFDVAHLAFALGPGVYCSSSTLKVTGTPAPTDLAGVAFGGGQWVTVGPAGTLATSPDGISWTNRTSSFGSTDITATAYGSGQWVAVGVNGKLATSPDGATWTQRTSGFLTTDIITGVAYANGQWVAVGNGGKLATSPDGVTWTQRTSGFGTTNIAGVAFGHGQWMVVGASSKVSTSVDGITWTPRTTGFSGNIAGVAYNGSDLWVLVGQNGKRATSSNDGVTWTAPIDSFGGVTMAGVAFGSGQWVAFGPSGTLYTSTNGATWSLVTAAGFGTTNDIAEVAYNGTDLWVAVGQGGHISTSANGTTWTSRSSDFNSTAVTLVSAGMFDTSVKVFLRSYWDNLAVFTTSTLSDKALHISSPGGEWQGLLYAPNGEIDFTGSAGSLYQTALWGKWVTMTGSNWALDVTGLGTAGPGSNHYTIGNLVE